RGGPGDGSPGGSFARTTGGGTSTRAARHSSLHAHSRIGASYGFRRSVGHHHSGSGQSGSSRGGSLVARRKSGSFPYPLFRQHLGFVRERAERRVLGIHTS